MCSPFYKSPAAPFCCAVNFCPPAFSRPHEQSVATQMHLRIFLASLRDSLCRCRSALHENRTGVVERSSLLAQESPLRRQAHPCDARYGSRSLHANLFSDHVDSPIGGAAATRRQGRPNSLLRHGRVLRALSRVPFLNGGRSIGRCNRVWDSCSWLSSAQCSMSPVSEHIFAPWTYKTKERTVWSVTNSH